MDTSWIIVDGYNLIHQEDSISEMMDKDIFLARQKLIRLLESAIPSLAEQITVVFDGSHPEGGVDPFSASPVEVRFSPAGSSADTIIERMVANAPSPASILVVTSDRLEANAVSGSGAQTTSCQTFLKRLATSNIAHSRTRKKKRKRPPLGTIGDLFPEVNQSKNNK